MIKPRIVGFLAKNEEKAFSSDELYQVLVPVRSGPDPESVGLPTDSKVRETYQLRISVARETFFIVKLRELVDRGDIIASEKDGETYFYSA